jgi:hypothetical protein
MENAGALSPTFNAMDYSLAEKRRHDATRAGPSQATDARLFKTPHRVVF